MKPIANDTTADRPARAFNGHDWAAAVCPPPDFVNVHLGRRFDADGVFLPEQGNTVVCQVIPGSETEAMLTDIRLVLQSLPYADHFAFTDPASYHMTLFEGVIESRRTAEDWPKGVATDLDIDAATQIMVAQLTSFAPPPAFRMAIRQVTPFGLRLTGATAQDEGRARNWRDQLAAAFGIQRSSHAAYGFHTTLAYLKVPLPADAVAEYRPVMDRLTQDAQSRISVIDLSGPALCRFRDMNSFPPVKPL